MIPVLSLTQVRISKFAVLFGDIVAFSVAFVIATFINVSIDDNQNIAVWFSTQDKERYATWFGLAFLGIMFFLMRFQHYSDRRPFWDELGDVLRLVSSLALLDMTLVAITRWNSSRLWWLIVWGLAVLTIVWGRMLTRFVLQQWGLWIRPTIIIGHGENATEAAIALQSEPRMGFEVAGYVDVDQPQPQLTLNGRTLKNIQELEKLAALPGIQWVIAPLMLCIAVALKLEGGSVFFAHVRVGKKGKRFNCFKFRSMVPNADQALTNLLESNPDLQAQWHKEHKLKDDPRISPLGEFLRRTSMDELPQLFNVLKNEMSLVGPRPIVEEELEKYGLEKSYYLMVRPGMTGLWQVSGRNDVDYDTRVYLDAWYVKNWSLWYDLAILVKTFKVVLLRRGAY